MYTILGCGRLGLEIVRGLDNNKDDILIIDENSENLGELEKEGFRVLKVDAMTSDILKTNVEKWDKVFVLGDDGDINVKLVKMVKKLAPKVKIVANAPDKESEKAMASMKNVITVRISEIATNALKSALETCKIERTASLLRKILQKTKDGTVAIFTHNAPDPDSMASALAFQAICDNEGIASKIYYGGEISHQENKEMVRLLEIDLYPIVKEEELKIALKNASKIVMIETAIPSENNVLPKDIVPNIVLDHHPTSSNVSASDLVEIRSDLGALSTLLTTYVQQLDVKVDAKLATALLYGIKVDTKAFTRNVSPTDLKAAAFLSPLANEKLLRRIESPPMSSETVNVIGNAIVNREIKDGVLFSAVGYVEERDALPQAAEFLMREKDVRVVGLCGIRGYNIHISARSSDPDVHIGEIAKKAFEEFGSAGGHASLAGAQIPLDKIKIKDKSDKELVANIVANMIRKLFFTALGIDISIKTI